MLPIFTSFSTDASGNITNWDVEIYTGTAGNFIYTLNDFIDNEDQGNRGDAGLGHNDLTPGVWTASTVAATPLPAALPLFSSALGALGLLGWKRKRKIGAALAA